MKKTLTIKFRNKFAKLLNDENRSAITSAFEKFFTFKVGEAEDYLWNLTYSMDIAMSRINELGLEGIIARENIPVLRNELRFQYKELYPDLLECEVPMTCLAAFEALTNKADIIVSNVIYRHCVFCVYDEEGLQRILFLLKSDKNNHRFGGIRSMCFDGEEALYLMKFHIEIHDLLKVASGHQVEMEKVSTNRPLADLNDKMQECNRPLNGETSTENQQPVVNATDEVMEEIKENKVKGEELMPNVAVDENKNPAGSDENDQIQRKFEKVKEFKKITAEEILEHRPVFEAFIQSEDWNVLTALGILGYDLNLAMAKKKTVADFIKVVDALTE